MGGGSLHTEGSVGADDHARHAVFEDGSDGAAVGEGRPSTERGPDPNGGHEFPGVCVPECALDAQGPAAGESLAGQRSRCGMLVVGGLCDVGSDV